MKLAGIALAWLAYFVMHSVLAASGVKAWIGTRWPRAMPGYRLAFNILATVTLLPVLWLVHGTESDWLWLWQWRGAWAWLANGLALAAVLGFFATGRSYDMGEFLGLRQLRTQDNNDPESFRLSFIHRFVRHPWYCIGLVLIWSRDMNGPLLVSATMITAYLVVGSKLEEGKLVASYGETYRRYMTQVPGLIPLPWKFLTATEAAALTSDREQR
jgi:protein-S-isoprenylcysteine O-methyltransferase Ste14